MLWALDVGWNLKARFKICDLVWIQKYKGNYMLYKLESLRGVAAILVVLFHMHWAGSGEQSPLISNSWIFVDFFFVLSGFVIAYAYIDKLQKGMGFYKYFGLRVGRLYPLHVFIMLMWLPYIGVKFYLYHAGFGGVDPSKTENVATFFVALFLINSYGVLDTAGWNGVSWSISAELFAYVGFFAIATLFKCRSALLMRAVLMLSIFSYVVLHLVKGPNLALANHWSFLRGFAGFCFGWFVYYVFLSNKISPSNIKYHEVSAIIFSAVFVSLITLNRYFSYIAVASFGYVVFVFAQSSRSYLGALLESTAAKALGRWSFSIYMIHLLIVSGLEDLFEHIIKIEKYNLSWVAYSGITLVVLGLIILMASFTYAYVEVPARNYFRRKLEKK